MGSHLRGRILSASVLIVGVSIASTFAPAAAAGRTEQVAIVSHMSFETDPHVGDFTTSGPAAESGLMCGSGGVTDTRIVFSGYQSNFQYQVLVLKDFICDDGSGTIHVKIQVHGNFDGTESFTWIVQGGTGRYSHLHGSGQGSSVPNADPSTGNTNIYEGFLVG